jgi:F-type H+-transporting ATPase subunit b
MDILNNFGFDPKLFIAQIINFVIVFFILKKIMYKPVLEILKKRDQEIKKGLKDSEDAQKLLEETQDNEIKILQKAQEKAENIINEAKIQAQELKLEAEQKTKRETELLMTQAKETIKQEEKAAEERLTEKIGIIALGLLEKSLVGVFGKEEQQKIMKKATTQLQKQL